MTNRFLLIVCLFFFNSACRNEDSALLPGSADVTVCAVRNPAQTLPWLRERIRNDEIDVVTATTYGGETYINLYRYIWSCSLCHLYRCDGSRVSISQLSPANQQELHKRLFFTNGEYVIYKRDP